MNPSRRNIGRKLFSTIFLCVLVLNIVSLSEMVNPVSGAPGLTRKWTRSLGSRALTTLAPLAADLNGDGNLEIVVVGGSSYGGEDGTITVLNGSTGSTIWQVSPGGVGTHSGFNIVDLDKDGMPEIVVSAKNTLVLRGKDGSVYWRNTAGPTGDEGLYNAVVDIDGDGYPTVFVSSGQGPIQGYDYITSLTYDGKIMSQAWSWHPCYGGLTVADANFDGKFELYQVDRSASFGGSNDTYFGGGHGLRAFDAETFTPLWNDPNILCSSQVPMLADVNKDGILEVIVGDQGSSGIAVLNSSDGSILTTEGKTRKGGTGMPVHSQPTIYDIDGDGNLEFINARNSQPKIWDLYDWKLDATLPLVCAEPPKVGDVNGDGKMDVIFVNGTDIYVYDITRLPDGTDAYTEVDHVSGLLSANAFALLQDVDGDNYNELVVTSLSGRVYCYDTTALAPTPRARSDVPFYSEYNLGAAEYVPTFVPLRPAILDERPLDGSVNQSLNPSLSIRVNDFQDDPVDIVFRTNVTGSWEIVQQYANKPDRVYNATVSDMNKHGSTYFWNVTVNDGNSGQNSRLFKFTTYSTPPSQGAPNLSFNGDDLVCQNETTDDPDNDEVTNIYNWYVNDASFTNLYLPFETHTTGNPYSGEMLLTDGFEVGFDNWNGNGNTDWDRTTTQEYTGEYSAHAGSADNYLISDTIDTSNAEGFTVSFWYRDHGIDDDDNVYLQFWNRNSSTYQNIFELGNTSPEDTWHLYTFQTYDPDFLSPDFRVRFNAVSIDTGEDLWIDDFSLTVPTRTMDYSGYDNLGSIHGATWTNQGVVGGAYVFDGKNDYIRVSDDPSLGSDGTWSEISLEFWIKPIADAKGTRIVAKKVAGQSTGSYMVGFQTSGSPSNTLFWGIDNGAGWQDMWDNTETVLTVGNWYHIVCTYKSGPGLTIYINGTQKANEPLTGNIGPGPGVSIYDRPLFIGYDGSGDVRRFLNGALDEVRIYPKALSQSQILQRFTETGTGLSSNSTIRSAETTTGEKWRCTVTPNDGFGDGVSKLSNTVTIDGELTHGLFVGFSGSGSTNVTGTHFYNSGTMVPVSATPDPSWTLFRWELNGIDAGFANPIVVTMDQDLNLTAVFVPIPTPIIVDNVDAGFSVVGSWPTTAVTGTGLCYGVSYRYNYRGTGLDKATWSFDIPVAGTWEVYAMWRSGTNRATNAPYTINHAGESAIIPVNQQINGGQWVSLGTFSFNAAGYSIILSDNANNVVIADAVRLVYVG